MSYTIHTSKELPRGCGYRKPGGVYLVCDPKNLIYCGKLPFPLEVCPTCNNGIKAARGWTWVDMRPLAPPVCTRGEDCHSLCPLREPPKRAGLLWVGEQFYATPVEWLREAARQGISRRVRRWPKGFRVGETPVYLAHRHALGEKKPGVIFGFVPDRIEYVVKGTEDDEELERLAERGFTLVKVIPIEEPEEVPV